MHESILSAYPQADISIYIVWVDMLRGDDARSAARSAQMFTDGRVRQFHDPHHHAADLVARQFLRPDAGPAWDIYIFFRKGGQWMNYPPPAAAWMHQLSVLPDRPVRADPERFKSGDALRRALREAMNELFSENREKADPSSSTN